MIVVKCDTCKISGAYAHLDCIASTVSDIGNRHSMQVTYSYKERTFNLFPPQLKTDLWMIWYHKLKLPLSAKYSQFQGKVIRVEQCAKFEAIPSIMHGTPQFYPFHHFKIRRWTSKHPTAAQITGSLFCTTLQWRHNESDGVSNHRRLDCLLNRLFRRRSKKTSKLRVTGLCGGSSPVIGEFPAVTGEFPEQKPVTRNMFPFDDVIMKTGNIDVGGECSSVKCKVSASP